MKFKRGNIHNIIFCLLALLPLVLLLISYFSTCFNYEYLNASTNLNETSFGVLGFWNTKVHDVIQSSNLLGIYSLYEFFDAYGILDSEICDFAFCYFGYLVYLEVFDLIYLAVYGFIRLIRSWIHKMGGDL